MNVVAHMIPMPRGPIKGTLSDADVKSLLVRAATARSIPELHAVIKTLVLNRLALVQVIEALAAEVQKSNSTAHSQFDLALLDQLKIVRAELDVAQRQRDLAQNEARTSGEKLTRMERMHDLAQRLAERVQRELLLANMEHERLGQENSAMAIKLEEQTSTLQLISDEIVTIRERMVRTDAALANTIAQGREANAERNALRIEIASSTSNTAELQRQLDGKTKLVSDLRGAIKRLVFNSAEDQRMIQDLSTKETTSRYEQHKKAPAVQPVAAASVAEPAANVVAFASRAELDKLRDQVRSRDTTIASKDQAIAQLTNMNGAMKTRMSEIESRFHQIDAANRAQSVAHESLAKTLLDLLPAEQRNIYSTPSYDAPSLMLIADAVKRHAEEGAVAQHYQQDGIGQSM